MVKSFWSFRVVFVVSGFHFGRFACFGGFSGFGGFVSLVSVVSVVSGFSFRSFRFVVSSFSTCPLLLMRFSARTRIAKTNVSSIERSFCVLKTRLICDIFLYY